MYWLDKLAALDHKKDRVLAENPQESIEQALMYWLDNLAAPDHKLERVLV